MPSWLAEVCAPAEVPAAKLIEVRVAVAVFMKVSFDFRLDVGIVPTTGEL